MSNNHCSQETFIVLIDAKKTTKASNAIIPLAGGDWKLFHHAFEKLQNLNLFCYFEKQKKRSKKKASICMVGKIQQKNSRTIESKNLQTF